MRFTKRAGRVLLAGVLTAGLAVVVQPSASAGPSDPRYVLVFDVHPTTVQDFDSLSNGDLTPVRHSCVKVRVVDTNGRTVASPGAEVTLTAPSAAGLGFNGGTPVRVATVDGVATFGDCPAPSSTDPDPVPTSGVTATGTGTFEITATGHVNGKAAKPAVSAPFVVLPVYGECGTTCTSGKLSDAARNTVAQVKASEGSGGRLKFSVDQDEWPDIFTSVCDGDENLDANNPLRRPVTVDLPGRNKTVELRWSKEAVQVAINNGAKQWYVCYAAEATQFLANGSPAPDDPARFAAVGGPAQARGTWWVGALLMQGDPALATDDPRLLALGRNQGEQVATVGIPFVPGDPRMI